MITGKDLIDLGYRPSKWFKDAIDYTNENNLSSESLVEYLKKVSPLIEPVEFRVVQTGEQAFLRTSTSRNTSKDIRLQFVRIMRSSSSRELFRLCPDIFCWI